MTDTYPPDSAPEDSILIPVPVLKEGVTVTTDDYGMLKIHALNGAQRQADGAAQVAEALRYDYMEGKHNVSLTEGLGVRYIQGPHPQFGSPDGSGGS